MHTHAHTSHEQDIIHSRTHINTSTSTTPTTHGTRHTLHDIIQTTQTTIHNLHITSHSCTSHITHDTSHIIDMQTHANTSSHVDIIITNTHHKHTSHTSRMHITHITNDTSHIKDMQTHAKKSSLTHIIITNTLHTHRTKAPANLECERGKWTRWLMQHATSNILIDSFSLLMLPSSHSFGCCEQRSRDTNIPATWTRNMHRARAILAGC